MTRWVRIAWTLVLLNTSLGKSLILHHVFLLEHGQVYFSIDVICTSPIPIVYFVVQVRRGKDMVNATYSINVFFDEDSKVFVGTSENIPGLTIETNTFGELIDTAMDIVPELLFYNLKIPEGAESEIRIFLHHPNAQKHTGNVPNDSFNRCRYVFEGGSAATA